MSAEISPRRTLLFTCGREPGYTRNAALQNALEQRFTLVRVTDASRSLLLRYLKVLWGLLTRRQPAEAAVVGFYGQPLMLAAPALIRLPILFDAFLSTYETLIVERGVAAPGSPLAALAMWLDRRACTAAGQVLLDTQADIDYFHETIGVPRQKMHRLFVGCNERLYFPRPEIDPVPGRVLFWGSYLPLQGFDTVIRAAAALKENRQIAFRLIGGGREFPKIRSLARELGANNVEFLPFRPEAELPDEIAQAAVILTGQFGNFDKSRRVIAGKTFQAMAMGRTPLVGDCPGNHELLTSGQDAVFIPMNDPVALACAIQELIENPAREKRLGQAARLTFEQRASSAVLGEELRQIIAEQLLLILKLRPDIFPFLFWEFL